MAGQSTIYRAAGKRAFDLAASAAGLFLLSPVFVLIAVLVKLTSRGPVFYRQERVGKSGHPLTLIKFRTMQVDADKKGPNITIGRDPRITSPGRMLRTLKIDELPQLWNVLRGDMSLVGPRPELPAYVAIYSEEQKKVLEVRPGITDAASIAYRNESELLAEHADPQAFYRDVILPHKLAFNLEYISQMSWRRDLRLLAKTCSSILFGRTSLIYSAPADKASSSPPWQIKSSS